MKRTQPHTGMAVWTALAFASLLVAGIGCQSGGDTDVTGLTSKSLAAEETLVATQGPPTLDELDQLLNLTPQQEQSLQTALDEWNQVIEVRRQERQTLREQRQQGERPRYREPGLSPILTFLAGSTDYLTVDQFVTLTEWLSERRQEHFENRQFSQQGPRGGHGVGQGNGKGDQMQGPGPQLIALADDLGLSSEQQDALADAFAEHHKAVMDLREQWRDGTIDQEAFASQMDALRDAMQETIESILTPEQLDAWRTLREKRREEAQTQREEHRQQRLEQRVAFLTDLLNLDAATSAELRNLLASAQADGDELREQLRDQDQTRDQIRDAMQQHRDETDDAIRALLTGDQVRIFDAIREFQPEGGQMMRAGGPRGGHGPGLGMAFGPGPMRPDEN